MEMNITVEYSTHVNCKLVELHGAGRVKCYKMRTFFSTHRDDRKVFIKQVEYAIVQILHNFGVFNKSCCILHKLLKKAKHLRTGYCEESKGKGGSSLIARV